MAKVNYTKGDAVKILDEDSKLIPIIEADGWKKEEKKASKKKED